MTQHSTTQPSSPGSGPAKRPAGRAGRDLGAAIGVGLAIGVLVVLALYLYRPAFGLIVLAAVVVAVREVALAVRHAAIEVAAVPLMLGGAAMCLSAWFYGLPGLAIALLMTFLAATTWRMSKPVDGFLISAAISAFIAVYIPFPAGFAILMANREAGALWIITWALAVVCNDTGGYAAGVLFGKHPMAPFISPKKSWEGFAGSLVAASVASVLMLSLALDGQWWHGIMFGLAIAMIATLGDLAESMIKRDLGIKDMSNLLPGHGGVMDRMDSLLFSAPIAWMLLTLFVA
ncbi:phosphatidate cytidylyltransferase [Blastococcus sp. Marseille-P5729]|uniref:phosphatidate cytidylyltransferase n=1 Tax=Blastococcus sp. Marseille-P5729 TaxID=2086582 RepID=UPI000D10F2E7|nr:phosphatidate cytidylyltransferase [Blastococcus sp. Marseille-P5729]